jgi:hypothetical protein
VSTALMPTTATLGYHALTALLCLEASHAAARLRDTNRRGTYGQWRVSLRLIHYAPSTTFSGTHGNMERGRPLWVLAAVGTWCTAVSLQSSWLTRSLANGASLSSQTTQFMQLLWCAACISHPQLHHGHEAVVRR